jgi:hypothetical protein
MVQTSTQPRRTPLEGFLPLLQSRAPGELHAFAALGMPVCPWISCKPNPCWSR